MQLSELLKEYSIETICEKTRIKKELIIALSEEDWSKFTKTQAIGFLNIIEREFDIDLSQTKQDCTDYFRVHQTKSEDYTKTIDLVDAQEAPKRGSFFLTFILTLLTFAVLAYAFWYFMQNNKSNNIIVEENTTLQNNSNNTTFYQNSIESAKDALEKVHQSITEKKQEEVSLKTNNQEANLSSEQNNSYQKFNINTPSQTSTDNQVQSLPSTASNSTKETENLSFKETKQQEDLRKKDIATTEQSTSLVEENTQEKNQTLQINEANKADEVENEANFTQQTEETKPKTVLIKPKKGLWIGIYNLKTHKKISKIINSDFTYQITDTPIAIITGHGLFSIKNNQEEKNPNSKKKQYILIDKEKIKFITRSEYKKLTKNRAW